jgi:diphthamide biosynthesis protein 2
MLYVLTLDLRLVKKTWSLCELRGKKPYLIAVGKPSPEKLGNFLEIDVFCLIACPENSILDSREFLKPIITPYELCLALDSEPVFPSKFELEFNAVNTLLDQELGKVQDTCDSARFSLATGKFVPARQTSNAIIQRSNGSVVHSPAADHLANRTFKGLDAWDVQPVGKTVQGRTGIAKSYHEQESPPG